MNELESSHPDILQQFNNGKFTMCNSHSVFSNIALDQGHEQNNAVMKGDGGFIGLTQDPDALLKWAVTGPEIVRVISEFEASCNKKDFKKLTRTCHHDQNKAKQERFISQVHAMITAIKDMGNPFECDSSSLIRLHTRDVLDDVSVDSIQQIKETGQKQYKDFIQERLVNRTKPVTDTLSRNNVSIFQKKST